MLVVESNYGDRMMVALLEQAIEHSGRHVPYRTVAARSAKVARAEAAAARYERGLASHVGEHDALEDQQLSFTGLPGEASDILDALGHALAELERYGVGRSEHGHETGEAIPWGAVGVVEGAAVPWESAVSWTPGIFRPVIRDPRCWCSVQVPQMGKRKGRQRETAFTLFADAEFKTQFYDRRQGFDAQLRARVEREAKARGLRNVQKRGPSGGK